MTIDELEYQAWVAAAVAYWVCGCFFGDPSCFIVLVPTVLTEEPRRD